MGRPRKGYFLDDQRVPGVTTVISRFKESGGLIHWAWKAGSEGKDYRDLRDSAASIGHLAHDGLEAAIHGKDMQAWWLDQQDEFDPDQIGLAQQAVANAVDDLSQYEGTFSFTEEPLVCPELRVGGTPDAVGKDRQGRNVLMDWKTGNSLYADAVIQCAVYADMVERLMLNEPIYRVKIFRFSKDTGDVQTWSFQNDTLDDARKLFSLYREAYELSKALDKRVR